MVDVRGRATFTLDDFRKLLGRSLPLGVPRTRMGPPPEVGETEAAVERDTEKQLRQVRGIIDAMTPEERRDPERLLDESRLRRIAAGAGVEPRDVRALARQFRGIAQIMDRLAAKRDGP
jgi:signal recognition particle subunit SRP54